MDIQNNAHRPTDDAPRYSIARLELSKLHSALLENQINLRFPMKTLEPRLEAKFGGVLGHVLAVVDGFSFTLSPLKINLPFFDPTKDLHCRHSGI